MQDRLRFLLLIISGKGVAKPTVTATPHPSLPHDQVKSLCFPPMLDPFFFLLICSSAIEEVFNFCPCESLMLRSRSVDISKKSMDVICIG